MVYRDTSLTRTLNSYNSKIGCSNSLNFMKQKIINLLAKFLKLHKNTSKFSKVFYNFFF